MAPAAAKRRRPPREPTLRDEIRASGETPVDEDRARRADEEDLAFLAREFLTWLVFHAETEGGSFAGEGDVPDFAIQFGGRLTLRAADGDVSEMVLKGPSPGVSADVRYALAGGLAVKEAELQLVLTGDEERGYLFALSAEYFDLKRVKIPALLTVEDDDRADERLILLSSLDAALALAFGQFLALRLQPAWSRTVVPALRRWIEAGT
jgi:hypothetical protein